jgi:TRAP-type uncharacterized transport system substrate-binding protein
MTFELPRWLRMVLFVLLLGLTIGLGWKVIQQTTKPTTLKLAVGSLDSEVNKVMNTIAGRMAATGAPVRITIIEKLTARDAAEAFVNGEADLAVVRGDNDEIASARAIVQMGNLVLMVMVPPNSPIKSVGDLKGKTVGVVGLEVNQRVLAGIVQSYGFAKGSVHFVNIPLSDLFDPARAKKYHAAIFVAPPVDKYIPIIRGFFPAVGKAQPSILEIESAEAIAASTKYFESYDMPKGTLRGAPPLPDDSLSTLRVLAYLVAKEKLSDDTAAALAKTIMGVRRELQGETPIVAQIAAPDDDKNAAIPIHPGAKAFFDGTEKTWSDKYGDWLFYGPIVLGMVGSFLAGLWRFLTRDAGSSNTDFANRLTALIERVRNAGNLAEIDEIERETDGLLSAYVKATAKGDIEAEQAGALKLIIGHLENAIDRRSRSLRERPPAGLTRSA